MRKKIKVGLIVDEFFGGAGTAFGGYGFLARRYIARYIPNEDIQIDVCSEEVKSIFQRNILEKMMLICINCRKLGLWPAVG